MSVARTDAARPGACDVRSLARKNILELAPYRCARDDYSSGVLLDANENSCGPCVTSFPELSLNRYPDPLHLELKAKIALFRGVASPENIFLGVGSDEAIDMLFRIFCVPSVDNVVITPPTYGMYKVCAAVNDVGLRLAPLTSTFDLDLQALQDALTPQSKLVFICSPGNPTSKVIPLADVEAALQIVAGRAIVIVDEAYIDFATSPSATTLLAKYSNLVVLQTLSKAFGLAGIRLGMAFASKEVVQLMNNVKAPYNISALTAAVAGEALEDFSLFEKQRDYLVAQRDVLLRELQQIAQVQKIHHADANFILFVIPQAKAIHLEMAQRGVVCRYRGTELHCTDCLRVTVGTDRENETFVRMLKEVIICLGL